MRCQVAVWAGAAALVSGSAWAQVDIPPGGVRHTVRPGETCMLITQHYYGDRAHLSRLHEGNPGLGPPPHHLTPGQVLLVLPLGAHTADPDARLTFLRNLVSSFTPDEHAGRRDEPLHRGHRVGTQLLSSAEVTFRDESRIQLESNTLVVILGDDRGGLSSRGQASDTTLMRGTLRAHLAELVGGAAPSTPTQLATPAARVSVDAGTAMVSVDGGRTTRLAVHRGRSRITGQRRTVAVPEGYGSRADVGQVPTPPRPLPAPPSWQSAPPSLLFAGAGRALLSARFQQVAGASTAAARWRVQLARDDRFNDLLLDETVDRAVDRFEARELAPGDYFVRVAAVDGDQFEGIATEALRVSVVLGEAPSTEGFAPVRWTIPEGARCSLDDGGFLPPGRELSFTRTTTHAIRCARGEDGARPSRWEYPAEPVAQREVAPTVAPPPPPPPPPPREVQRFSLRLDAEVVPPRAGEGTLLGGALRAGWSPLDAVALQAGASTYLGAGSTSDVARSVALFAHLGLRVEPRVHRVLRLAGELEGGATLVGGVRTTLGAGAGLEFVLGARWGLGAMVRYRRAFAEATTSGTADDRSLLSAGLSVVWRSGE